jgi:hypothetical protein
VQRALVCAPVALPPTAVEADPVGTKVSAASVASTLDLYPGMGTTDLLQVEEVRTWD